MAAAGGSGDGNKIVIELEVRVKELQQQLNDAQKKIDGFEGKQKGHRTRRKKDHKEQLKETAAVHKAQKDLVKTYDTAAKSSTRMQRAWSFIRKDTQQTAKDIKAISKHDVGKGFFGGLARGSGAAGIYQSIRGQPGGPGLRQRLGGAIGRGVTGAASMAGGFIMGGMQSAYEKYMQFGAAQWGMAGLGSGKADRGRGRKAFGAGVKYGFTPTETAQMAPGVAAATGQLGSTTLAQQFAMGGGYGPGRVGEAVQYMGTMRQAGTDFGGGGKGASKELSKTIAAGMYSGLEKARLPEFYEGVRGLVQSQFSTAAGKVDSINIAKQLAMIGKGGGVGFQGARGSQVLGQLDQMIKSPGGGEAGQAMILQAMGFGKPGGTVNYYDALKGQQEGIRDPDNIKKVMKEVYSQRGNIEAGGSDPINREANLQFSMMSGLSIKQTEQLKDIYSSSKSQEEKDKEINEVLQEAKPIQERALDAAKDGFAAIKKHIAGVEAQQIRIGSKIAKPMMELQDLQLKILGVIAGYFPQMIDFLKKLWGTLKEIGIFIKDMAMAAVGKSEAEYEKDIENRYKGRIDLIKKFAPKTSADFLNQQSGLQQAAYQKATEATKTTGPTALLTYAGLAGERKNQFGGALTRRTYSAKLDAEAAQSRSLAGIYVNEALKAQGLVQHATGPEAQSIYKKMGNVAPGQAGMMAEHWLPQLVEIAKKNKEAAEASVALAKSKENLDKDAAAWRTRQEERERNQKAGGNPKHGGVGTRKATPRD